MRTLHFDQTLTYQTDYPIPTPPPGEALIKTTLAGICNTDIDSTFPLEQGLAAFEQATTPGVLKVLLATAAQ